MVGRGVSSRGHKNSQLPRRIFLVHYSKVATNRSVLALQQNSGNLWLPCKERDPHIFSKSSGCSGRAGSALQLKCLPVEAEQTLLFTYPSSSASQAVLLLWDVALGPCTALRELSQIHWESSHFGRHLGHQRSEITKIVL